MSISQNDLFDLSTNVLAKALAQSLHDHHLMACHYQATNNTIDGRLHSNFGTITPSIGPEQREALKAVVDTELLKVMPELGGTVVDDDKKAPKFTLGLAVSTTSVSAVHLHFPDGNKELEAAIDVSIPVKQPEPAAEIDEQAPAEQADGDTSAQV